MYLTLGHLIDELEKLRQKHDSATTVAIDDADTGWHLSVQTVKYDAKRDRVLLAGDYHVEGGRLEDARG